ncbi:hypothetical protein [Myxococcus xanthus]|uniref:Uncharacterized protein n=1 Tax=Myxococcus xanthus TaxID=34 RepID=A0A7Y4IRT4_MYXXA|nr:hypothetical protein [Myxococcus xanthus]NOJ83810.1 hypothetical protein [Myxococcus xanthus]NOJ91150.1 hypothetical protein [Myxococcus xanthus]
MRRDSRLSVAWHVLLHLEDMGPGGTSEAMGRLLKANPVVVLGLGVRHRRARAAKRRVEPRS